MKPRMTHESFVAATRSAAWADIEALKAMLDASAFWDEAFVDEAVDAHKKAYIRRAIRRITDDAGWPVFASVVTFNPETGDEERRYKQETLFDRDDYAQVVRYHERQADHHLRMAQGYADHARARYGMQLRLELLPT